MELWSWFKLKFPYQIQRSCNDLIYNNKIFTHSWGSKEIKKEGKYEGGLVGK